METPQIVLDESPSSKELELEQEGERSEEAGEEDAAAEQDVDSESQPEPLVDNVSTKHSRILIKVLPIPQTEPPDKESSCTEWTKD